MKVLSSLVFFMFVSACFFNAASAEVIFMDDFDNEVPDEGSPDNCICFGTALTSATVNTRNPFSGTNSAIVTLHFLPGTWGGGMIIKKFEPRSFRNAVISASVSASQDLSALKPILAFRIEDADGTIMRADANNMFAPSLMYNNFSLPVENITQVDYRGADSIIDLDNIVSFGFCIYNYGKVSGVVHFYVDDVKVEINTQDSLTSSSYDSGRSAQLPPASSTGGNNSNENKRTNVRSEALSRW